MLAALLAHTIVVGPPPVEAPTNELEPPGCVYVKRSIQLPLLTTIRVYGGDGMLAVNGVEKL